MKRRYLESLLTHDAIGLQETRGSAGDLATLPQADHKWYDSFLEYSAGSGGSRGGGVAMAVSRRILSLYPRVENVEVLRGRAHMVRCRPDESDEGVMFLNLHIDPAWTLEAKNRMIDAAFAQSKASTGCVCFLFGDLNMVHTDDHRVDMRRLDVVPIADLAASYFEHRMRGFVEFEQLGYMRRQTEGGVPVLLSAAAPDRHG